MCVSGHASVMWFWEEGVVHATLVFVGKILPDIKTASRMPAVANIFHLLSGLPRPASCCHFTLLFLGGIFPSLFYAALYFR